jgi:hypothetical protein
MNTARQETDAVSAPLSTGPLAAAMLAMLP